MNKKGFIEKLAERTGLSKKDVKLMVDALPDTIKDAVVAEGKLSLTGFITFEKKDVGKKTGTVRLGENKGSEWVAPAHSEVKVRLSKTYRML